MREKEYSGSRELFGRSVKAGSRVYFIDAKEDVQGNRYLVVSESHINAKTKQRERQRVFVYQEDIQKFMAALNEVVDMLDAPHCVALSEGKNLATQRENTFGAIESMELPDVDQFLAEGIE